MVIDLFGLTSEEVRSKFPTIYQWILERVKPERDQNNREGRRKNWWLFGETNPKLRDQLTALQRYITTGETSKHRIFQFLDAKILPDNKLVNIALADALYWGVLSSRLHIAWSLAAGSRLGVGNDPVYVKTICFEAFPFPEINDEKKTLTQQLAEQIDAHRKRQQAQFPELTLTGMYNVLEKIRAGEVLNAKEKIIHEQGLVSVLRELHDNLDRAVFAAYGWDDLAEKLVGKPGATTPLPDKSEAQAEAEEELLRRLVELNAQRAAEEARGIIRWLRPDYQNPSATIAPQQVEAELKSEEEIAPAEIITGKLAWPKSMRDQVSAVRSALANNSLSADAVANQFKRSPKVAVTAVLEALEGLGMVVRNGDVFQLQG